MLIFCADSLNMSENKKKRNHEKQICKNKFKTALKSMDRMGIASILTAPTNDCHLLVDPLA